MTYFLKKVAERVKGEGACNPNFAGGAGDKMEESSSASLQGLHTVDTETHIYPYIHIPPFLHTQPLRYSPPWQILSSQDQLCPMPIQQLCQSLCILDLLFSSEDREAGKQLSEEGELLTACRGGAGGAVYVRVYACDGE